MRTICTKGSPDDMRKWLAFLVILSYIAERIMRMLALFVSGALILGMLALLKVKPLDPEEWADRKEYQKFWRDLESWKNPVRWA